MCSFLIYKRNVVNLLRNVTVCVGSILSREKAKQKRQIVSLLESKSFYFLLLPPEPRVCLYMCLFSCCHYILNEKTKYLQWFSVRSNKNSRDNVIIHVCFCVCAHVFSQISAHEGSLVSLQWHQREDVMHYSCVPMTELVLHRDIISVWAYISLWRHVWRLNHTRNTDWHLKLKGRTTNAAVLTF